MSAPGRRVLLDPLLDRNPVTLHVLGICSALAVTTALAPALTMSLAFVVVATASSGIISAIRGFVPSSVRLIVQMTIVASLVMIVDLALEAWAFEMSKRLSVFVSLIVTNCIVLGRAEGFAMQNRVGPSLLDGLGNGLGYALVLVTVGGLRELLGSGRLLGRQVLPLVSEGGWFQPDAFVVSPPGAFLLLGGLTWLMRSLRRDREAAPAPAGAGAAPEVSHA